MDIKRLYARRGDPVSHERWNALLDLVADLLEGPRVCAPLAVSAGVIYLGEEYAAWDGVTTTAFVARSGSTMASGSVRLVMAKGATLTTLSGGGTLVTAYNFTGGAIASGVRVVIIPIRGEWRIISADCSGVAA